MLKCFGYVSLLLGTASLDVVAIGHKGSPLSPKYRKSIMYPPRKFAPLEIPPQEQTKKNFLRGLMDAFNRGNTPYSGRRDGLFYRADYLVGPHTVAEEKAISWAANARYFDMQMPGGFCVLEKAKPSEALQAFFQGPTIADCTTVLQAAYWWAALHVLGSEAFDAKFQRSALPFCFNANCNKAVTTWRAKRATTPASLGDFLEPVEGGDVQPGDSVYIEGHPLSAKKSVEIFCW